MKKLIFLLLAVLTFGFARIAFVEENKPVAADRWGAGRWDQIENFNKKLRRSVYGSSNLSFAVGVENALEKVYRDKYWFRGELTDNIYITCARSEYENFQLAVIPVHETSLSDVDLSFSDFVHKQIGARIDRMKIADQILKLRGIEPEQFMKH